MDRLAVATVTPVPSVPPHQHGMHQPPRPHHISCQHPKSSLGSDIPGPSGSCYSLPSQLTGTPGGGTLRNAFIPISAHPAVCPELPKQFLLLFSCLDPSDVLPAGSLTQKRGFGVCDTPQIWRGLLQGDVSLPGGTATQ